MDKHQVRPLIHRVVGKAGPNPRRISPLELLLPNGFAKRSVVFGSNLPKRLLPECYTTNVEPADLALLAPTATECRSSGWLKEAVRVLAGSLEPDGILYALAPRPFRPTLKRLMRDHGLLTGLHMAHLPNFASSRYLVPVSPVNMHYTLTNLLFAGNLKQWLATSTFGFLKSQELISTILPFVGLVARHSDARPLLDWLFKLGNESGSAGNAIIRSRLRAEKETAVIFRFPKGSALPDAAAKVSLAGPLVAKTPHEAAVMTRFGSSARSAGAQVPKVFLDHHIAEHSVVLQTVLDGRSAADLLLSQSKSLPVFMEHISQWLDRWNRATAAVKPLDSARLERELIAPVKFLDPYIKEGREYREWLTTRFKAALGTVMPFVVVHGDLSMTNVLINKEKKIGIIDWEASACNALPLSDFFYAAADAAAAVHGYVERLQAFQTCFVPGGSYVEPIRALQLKLRRSLNISADIADFCFHACWLSHAVNESRSEPPHRRRFLEIVQFVAYHRYETIGWLCS